MYGTVKVGRSMPYLFSQRRALIIASAPHSSWVRYASDRYRFVAYLRPTLWASCRHAERGFSIEALASGAKPIYTTHTCKPTPLGS
jgi:hypothetical protein